MIASSTACSSTAPRRAKGNLPQITIRGALESDKIEYLLAHISECCAINTSGFDYR